MKYALIFALLLTGCSSLEKTADSALKTEETTQMHALKVRVNGAIYTGIGTLPLAEYYDVTVFPDDRISRIVWTTCHQQNVKDKPATGWFDTSFTFRFVPSEIEDGSSCQLKISIVMENVATDFALFEFKDRRTEVNLVPNIACNGWGGPLRGVGICQSAAGLRQKLVFDEPVIVPAREGCNVMKTGDEKVYLFETAVGECTYYFTAQSRASNGKRRLFRLTTIGYNSIPKVR